MDDTGPPNQLQQLHSTYSRRLQQMLDRSSPHVTGRWVGLALLALLYTARVWWLRGFYIITYAIAIYNLNLLLGFLTPQVDPETAEDGPELPTKADQEFKPFIRRLPEFKFWWSATKSFLIGFTVTFFKVFDVPVFWPILLLYWFVLFFVTMKRQIMHMIKYKYLPFSLGKKRYSGKGGEKRPLKDAKDEGPSTTPVAVTTAVAPVVGVPQSGPAPNLRQVAAGSQGGAPPHVVAGTYGVAPAAGNYGVAPTAYAPAPTPMLYQQPRPTGQPDMVPGAVPVYGSGQPANGQPSSRPPGTMLPL